MKKHNKRKSQIAVEGAGTKYRSWCYQSTAKKKHEKKAHEQIEVGQLHVPSGTSLYRRMNTSIERQRRPSGKESASSGNGGSKKAKKLLKKKAAEVTQNKGIKLKKIYPTPGKEESNHDSNAKVSSKNLSIPSKKESAEGEQRTKKKEPTKKASQVKRKDNATD